MEKRERRPRHTRGNPRNPRNSHDGKSGRDRAERDFQREIEMRLQYFVESEEKELEFEPMNSFKRRHVHNIAKTFNMESYSRGDEPARYVAVVKTAETEVPKTRKPRKWDFGTQSFPIHPGQGGVHLALKLDGSIEMFREEDKDYVLDHAMVTAHEIRIRNGKILQPGEEGF
ncbi:MAG: hypothetical protein HY342_05865 [Candidatus Lambdaproteobacteria bacterium]|nr:hypothetical protein [Candidatus Lambdaproteobacteria bacterium]